MTSVPPEELAKSAHTLMRSSTVTNAVKWLLVAVVLPAAGWAIAKLDTKDDLQTLRLSVDKLTAQQIALVSRLDETGSANSRRMLGIQRDVVVVAGYALAYETKARADQKREAGDQLAAHFDSMIQRGESPALAAQNVMRNVALPTVPR